MIDFGFDRIRQIFAKLFEKKNEGGVWFSERDIRLIVRIFDFKEYIFNFEDQSLKDF